MADRPGATVGGVAKTVVLTAIPVLFVLVALAVAYRLRRPVQRRWFADTRLEQWRGIASGLAWADRWRLYVANSFGRAAEPRLARLAAERGEVMSEALSAQASGGRLSGFRWL